MINSATINADSFNVTAHDHFANLTINRMTSMLQGGFHNDQVQQSDADSFNAQDNFNNRMVQQINADNFDVLTAGYRFYN